jgi:flagellar hook-associated protein 2
MSSVSGLFTGNSTYSSDFVQVIDRAVQIASLPIDQLSNQKNTLSNEQTALSSLSTAFSSLGSALTALNTAADTGRYAVSYSDSTIATASASSGALAGTYTVQVIDAGSQARANSTATVTDPSKASISSASSFSLTVNGTAYTNIQPTGKTLNSLAEAINTKTKGDVQATVVNIGTNSSPSYQLSIQNKKYGTSTITLVGDAGNLLGTPTAATSVQYRINGQPADTPVSSDTRTVTIAPHVMVTVLKAGTTDVTVGQSTSAMASALNGFVTAYNAVTKALDAHRGSSNGALAGQSIVSTLSEAMRQIAGYSASGTVKSMSDIGLTFDKNGVLSFDSAILTATAAKDFTAVTDFLGSTTGTGGFLKAANTSLTSITDSTKGVLPAASSSVGRQITNTESLIESNQDRVNQMKYNLNAQMAAADALIASLQQQVTYFTSMFAAMQANQNSMNL